MIPDVHRPSAICTAGEVLQQVDRCSFPACRALPSPLHSILCQSERGFIDDAWIEVRNGFTLRFPVPSAMGATVRLVFAENRTGLDNLSNARRVPAVTTPKSWLTGAVQSSDDLAAAQAMDRLTENLVNDGNPLRALNELSIPQFQPLRASLSQWLSYRARELLFLSPRLTDTKCLGRGLLMSSRHDSERSKELVGIFVDRFLGIDLLVYERNNDDSGVQKTHEPW